MRARRPPCVGCDWVFNLAADMGGMGFIQVSADRAPNTPHRAAARTRGGDSGRERRTRSRRAPRPATRAPAAHRPIITTATSLTRFPLRSATPTRPPPTPGHCPLCARRRPLRPQSNHSRILYNSTMISFNMAEAARLAGVKRFWYASSACIYPEFKQLTEEVRDGP